ncbi:MAG: 50S ribosomal protein L11 methyltransferase [Gammaproteobacteria bacterium]|nr:50S ribosomal protein L11 methyltransferase [Gammaproteobacteria bacterium]
MEWLQVCIQLGRSDPEPLVAALENLGAAAIEYRDAADQAILEPAPGDMPLWRELRVQALFPANVPEDLVRLTVAAATGASPLPGIEFTRLPERDWVRDFNASLEPMCFADRLWICPTQSDCPEPDAASIFLDPGLAFGSGHHPTTALCLEWLAGREAGRRVLDYGCGSGVLALAALALGAGRVDAVDNDPQALIATQDNAAANGLADRIAVYAPDDLPPASQYDVVVANIVSGVLIDLAAALGPRCESGAAFALSGILIDQADEVRTAYSRWVRFDVVQERHGWALLSGIAGD